MQRIKLKKEPVTQAKKQAFTYQKAAFESIKDLEYAAIFHEQGLGKTKIAIDIILHWLQMKTVDSIIILTKKSLINNWKEELSFHSFLKPKTLSVDKNKNYYIFNNPSRVVLCNFEMIISEKERVRLFQKTRSVGIIIDESARLKNPKSTTTKTLFELAEGFSKRIIMTGTPIPNRPYDIWAQIFFLDQGKSLGEDFNSFKKNTDLSNDLSTNTNKRCAFEKIVQGIFGKIDSFCVRETKDSGVVKLPDKQYLYEEATWETHQLDLYNHIKDELRAYVIKNEKAQIDESDVVLKRLLRLVQVASNPALVDESYDQEPGKLPILSRILSVIASKGEKVIIWTCFTNNADWLAETFQEYKAVRVHGKMDMTERNCSIKQFKTDDAVRILIATPAAAKEGLTLTAANNVVFYDRGFALDDYLQAQDRIHRISQDKTCNIFNIIMKDSIDEWVDVLLDSKHNAAKLGQGDIAYNDYVQKMDYSFGEIIHHILFGAESEKTYE